MAKQDINQFGDRTMRIIKHEIQKSRSSLQPRPKRMRRGRRVAGGGAQPAPIPLIACGRVLEDVGPEDEFVKLGAVIIASPSELAGQPIHRYAPEHLDPISTPGHAGKVEYRTSDYVADILLSAGHGFTTDNYVDIYTNDRRLFHCKVTNVDGAVIEINGTPEYGGFGYDELPEEGSDVTVTLFTTLWVNNAKDPALSEPAYFTHTAGSYLVAHYAPSFMYKSTRWVGEEEIEVIWSLIEDCTRVPIAYELHLTQSIPPRGFIELSDGDITIVGPDVGYWEVVDRVGEGKRLLIKNPYNHNIGPGYYPIDPSGGWLYDPETKTPINYSPLWSPRGGAYYWTHEWWNLGAWGWGWWRGAWEGTICWLISGLDMTGFPYDPGTPPLVLGYDGENFVAWVDAEAFKGDPGEEFDPGDLWAAIQALQQGAGDTYKVLVNADDPAASYLEASMTFLAAGAYDEDADIAVDARPNTGNDTLSLFIDASALDGWTGQGPELFGWKNGTWDVKTGFEWLKDEPTYAAPFQIHAHNAESGNPEWKTPATYTPGTTAAVAYILCEADGALQKIALGVKKLAYTDANGYLKVLDLTGSGLRMLMIGDDDVPYIETVVEDCCVYEEM